METFTHTTASGEALRFAHLTLYDVYGDPRNPKPNGIVPGYRRRLLNQLIADLDDVGATVDQKLAEVAGFNGAHGDGRKLFHRLIDEPAGKTEVIDFAWGAANPGRDRPVLATPDFDAVRDALFRPFGIGFTAAADEGEAAGADAADKSATYGDGGADGPNAVTPETYSATETAPLTEPGTINGAPSPTSSQTSA